MTATVLINILISYLKLHTSFDLRTFAQRSALQVSYSSSKILESVLFLPSHPQPTTSHDSFLLTTQHVLLNGMQNLIN